MIKLNPTKNKFLNLAPEMYHGVDLDYRTANRDYRTANRTAPLCGYGKNIHKIIEIEYLLNYFIIDSIYRNIFMFSREFTQSFHRSFL